MSRAWSFADTLQETYRQITGAAVEYDVRPYDDVAKAIDAIGAGGRTEHELRVSARLLRKRARDGEPIESLLLEALAVAREMASHVLGMRPFDVQMAAAVAMHRGKLVQLATGEGKTLVAALAALVRALAGNGVHVFTANDYLARRDAEWMGALYRVFDLEAAFVIEGLTREARRHAYACDITYVTAKEAGFDFLRDHAADDPTHIVHRGHEFAIVDEADFILIDEARVPLVIAGDAPPLDVDPVTLAGIVRRLRSSVDYTADEYGRTVVLTEAGFRHAGTLLGTRLDDPSNHLLLSAVHVALHAESLLRRDRDYVVRDGRVEIVDEWTGRVADNRRWPHGIQPAVEAKEGVPIQREGRILGSIPLQHCVRMYSGLAGMTATAETAAEEFRAFFGLTTVVFPPNRACLRSDEADAVFTDRAAKTAALVDEIVTVHATGRPVLVGTSSVRESEELAALLRARGLSLEVLNARQDAHEAQIIARAGTLGALTISTNMAGRGTDIVLGGSDLSRWSSEGAQADQRQREAVQALGGLYVIGTNRHESRRIDDQLRGRAGRQGDPGTSRFFISLEDDLIQRYGVMSLIPSAHRPVRQRHPIKDPIVSREIARAQRIVEGQNFEIRRTLWKYTALVEDQRRVVYDWRESLLEDDADPAICATESPERYEALAERVGADAVRRAEQAVTIHALDRGWSDHLALVEDIREGIHLQRYGGREPIAEFNRQIIEGFRTMMDRVRVEAVELFERLEVTAYGGIDLAAAGIGRSSSTWTYLVNDNPFSTLGLSLLASRNIGAAGAAGLLAAIYLPVTAIGTAVLFLRRWFKSRSSSGRR